MILNLLHEKCSSVEAHLPDLNQILESYFMVLITRDQVSINRDHHYTRDVFSNQVTLLLLTKPLDTIILVDFFHPWMGMLDIGCSSSDRG